jgi:hypothetical protein
MHRYCLLAILIAAAPARVDAQIIYSTCEVAAPSNFQFGLEGETSPLVQSAQLSFIGQVISEGPAQGPWTGHLFERSGLVNRTAVVEVEACWPRGACGLYETVSYYDFRYELNDYVDHSQQKLDVQEYIEHRAYIYEGGRFSPLRGYRTWSSVYPDVYFNYNEYHYTIAGESFLSELNENENYMDFVDCISSYDSIFEGGFYVFSFNKSPNISFIEPMGDDDYSKFVRHVFDYD